jgi:hypothetical protein
MASEKPIEYHIEKIKEFHKAKLEYPDSETIERKLYEQLSQWEYKLKKKYIVSGQENYPWGEDKLGHQTEAMLTLTETDRYFSKKWLAGHRDKINLFEGFEREDIQPQCGDYQGYIVVNGKVIWIPIVVERKGGKEGKSGADDLYGSTSSPENRRNLYEEIERMKLDKRFSYRYLIAECSFKDYMDFAPLFNGKQRNVNHFSLSPETKRATIAGLEIRGLHVIWAGTRAKAIQMYIDLNRQWIMKNYVKILGLDVEPYNDLKSLRDKLDYHKACIKGLDASIRSIEKQMGVLEVCGEDGSLERLGVTI